MTFFGTFILVSNRSLLSVNWFERTKLRKPRGRSSIHQSSCWILSSKSMGTSSLTLLTSSLKIQIESKSTESSSNKKITSLHRKGDQSSVRSTSTSTICSKSIGWGPPNFQVFLHSSKEAFIAMSSLLKLASSFIQSLSFGLHQLPELTLQRSVMKL